MGNLIVTQKDLRALEERLEERLDTEVKSLKESLAKERRYENGVYYRNLKDMWDPDSRDFEGAAAEWEKYRKKDVEALEYYMNPKSRGDHQVRY